MPENLKVALLLHFYQPWWQFPHVLEKVVDQCYRPILRLVEKMPGFCFSANINYSLLELLLKWGKYDDVIFGFKNAADSGKIELLGSTAYHPIMPLVPKEVQIAQLRADNEWKKDMGIKKNCAGIFLPEMAYSSVIFPTLREEGYSWTVLDDDVFTAQYGCPPYNEVARIKGLKTLFRSKLWSNRIAVEEGYERIRTFSELKNRMFSEFPRWTKNQMSYLVLAMDAETFGHHRPLIGDLLEPLVKEWGNGNILTPLENIISSFPERALVQLFEGSWSTSKTEYYRDNVFPLWNSKHNEHHRDLWKLVSMALNHFDRTEYREYFLKMTSSCHWWWLSGGNCWDPDFMKFGARKAISVLRQCGTAEEVSLAEEIYKRLKSLKK